MKLTLKRPNRVSRTENHEGYDVIHTENVLRTRALVYNRGQTAIDEEAIARADQAMQQLAGEFTQWMESELARLLAAWGPFKETPSDKGRFTLFHRAAHDIKGQAATFGYPLAGQAADSLCALLEKLPRHALPLELVERHVEAIRAITHHNALGATDQVGTDLVTRLNEIAQRIVSLKGVSSPGPEGGPRFVKASAA